MKKFNLNPARSSDDHRTSASDIVVIVLEKAMIRRGIDYKSVEKIWTDMGRWLLPDDSWWWAASGQV